MPTTKHRINITATPVVEAALRKLAKLDRVPVASKAAELLERALDMEEDIALAHIVDIRMKRPARFIEHDAAWK